MSDEVSEVLESERWPLCLVRAHSGDEKHELDDAVRLDGAVQAVCAPECDCVLDDLRPGERCLALTGLDRLLLFLRCLLCADVARHPFLDGSRGYVESVGWLVLRDGLDQVRAREVVFADELEWGVVDDLPGVVRLHATSLR